MIVVGLALAVLVTCQPPGPLGPPAGLAPSDYSGTYFVTIGHSPRFAMSLAQDGGDLTFTITGGNLDLHGVGTLAGATMTLQADVPEFGQFTATAEFAPDGQSFLGAWEMVGGNPIQGTITGTTEPWPVHDVETLGVPRFAVGNCIELLKIRRVSRFRSGAGHDYSDDTESCRSMKHYYEPKPAERRTSVRLFAPVTGTVIGTTDEWDGPELWKGTVVGIRVAGHEAFDVVLFHIRLIRDLEVGDVVVAGEELGTSAKVSGTVTDVAVGVHTPAGYRLVSYFEAMSDTVFRLYRERGADGREVFIIPRTERDADPLSCQGEQFEGEGNLENYVTLWDQPVPRTAGPGRLVPQ